MRHLRGFEAVQVADTLNVPLYDLQYSMDITVDQAREFIESGRDVRSFVLKNWPDSDDEAEQLVLKEFKKALKEHHWCDARVSDFASDREGGLQLHPVAAEEGARRLVQQGKLELIEDDEEFAVYGLPRNVRFSDSFMVQMRDVVCDQCAHLDLESPFHDACLMNLIDFLQHNEFTFDHITELSHAQQEDGRFARMIKPGGLEWLSKTASVARSKWKNVLKYGMSSDQRDARDTRAPRLPESIEATRVGQGHTEPSHTAMPASSAPTASTTDAFESPTPLAGNATADIGESVVPGQRPVLTKEALIQYLRRVDVVDQNGELDRVKQSRDALSELVSQRDREIERVEKQRLLMEKQVADMQRDMDTLIHAMKIAKKYDQEPVHVIDATIDNSEHSGV